MKTYTDAAQAMLAYIVETKGYDFVSWINVGLDSYDYKITFNIVDTFQDELSYSERVRSGYESFEASKDSSDPIAIIWDAVRALPSREMRELEVMSRSTASTVAMQNNLKSAMAQQFVKELVETRNTNLLPKPQPQPQPQLVA